MENLVNKRRQIADSNPKNTTHFSGNSLSSTNSATGVDNTIPLDAQKVPKSIIIGAGQPIVVPGQKNPTTNASNASNQIKQNTIGVLTATVNTTPSTNRSDSAMTSVEEFCPDGGTLDKSFLDETPAPSNPISTAFDANYDSDSDSNEIGNPLVAKFHDDPSDDLASLNLQQLPKPNVNAPKVNPLARNKTKRQNSLSSEDTELPSILKDSLDFGNASGSSKKEFDSWLSDSIYRRSPEGIEAPSVDKNVNHEIIAVDSFERINSDDVDDTDKDAPIKEAKTKSKKKKKDKKEKHEKSEKSKKRASQSKKCNTEHMLTEHIDSLNHDSVTIEDQYEALH